MKRGSQLHSSKECRWDGVKSATFRAANAPRKDEFTKTLEFQLHRVLTSRWIDFVRRSKHRLSGIKAFANGLSRDIQAIENGIFMTWSNGAAEGYVNRIKSIKRIMYGRAGFELLRRKVILSQTG